MTKKKGKSKELEITKSACRQLFDYARQFVSLKDIAGYCPSDPGYYSYVREFTELWEKGDFSRSTSFDVSETVLTTLWSRSDDVRFRRFRIFSNAVGIVVSNSEEGANDSMPTNYFVASLLDDALVLEDAKLLHQLVMVFAEFHLRVKEVDRAPEEGMFLLLGQMILSFMGYRSMEDVPRLAEQIIKEADYYRREYATEFFWECTGYDQLHPVWKSLVKRCFPVSSPDESVALLREALLGNGEN